MTLATLKETALFSLAVRRLRLLPRTAGPADPRRKLVFLGELASLGYKVENPEDYDDSLLHRYSHLVRLLTEMRGGTVDYVPLFQGFPESVPDDDRYFSRRLLGYLGNFCRVFDEGTRLENGMRIPEWLFDLRQFGADPITQMQDETLHRQGVERQAARKQDTHVEWIPLRIAGPEEVEDRALAFLRGCLYSRSSIQETLREDLETLLDRFSPDVIDPAQVVFKETRTHLMKYFWQQGNLEALEPYGQTPTDLLRLFAALTGGDVSLAEKIRFPKMTRPQRRFVLGCLERCANLAEDLRRYRGLWVAVGRGLHPGAEARRFPKTAAAFDTLRNLRVDTFDSCVEEAIRDRDLDVLVAFLRERPGSFARRLHHVLELAGDRAAELLESFRAVAPQVPLKNLLVMETHFRTIEDSPRRAVLNKSGRVRVLPNRMHRLAPGVADSVGEVLSEAIAAQLRARPPWEGRRAWIDPALRSYTVPLQLRKASEGLLTLGRGTRLPLDLGKVLRLFVYWKESTRRTDLDLSVIQYDRNLQFLGHVSYTRLKTEGIAHSGDMQSAPHGAAEFIDLDLGHLEAAYKCRYIAPQVYRFCGDPFSAMQCHAGWMIREDVNPEYQTFDIKTVQNKFDLAGSGSYCIPLIVDLWDRSLVYVDLYVNGVHMENRVEGAFNDISTVTGELVRFLDTRPNLHDLAMHHVNARGAAPVEDRAAADLTFGLADCDYGVDRMERILSELL